MNGKIRILKIVNQAVYDKITLKLSKQLDDSNISTNPEMEVSYALSNNLMGQPFVLETEELAEVGNVMVAEMPDHSWN